jgi:hypothetical protein
MIAKSVLSMKAYITFEEYEKLLGSPALLLGKSRPILYM